MPNAELNKKKWHALYVASRQEKNAMRLLNEKNIEAYTPVVKTMKQWSDRKKMVELPLLNGYLFVKIAVTESDKVRQTKGVVNFVRSEGKVAIVRDVEIDIERRSARPPAPALRSIPGSARVSRAGFGVSPKQSFI